MARFFLVVGALTIFMFPAAAYARDHNPVFYHGHPMSCPDPDVFRYGSEYVAACTSDFGQDNPTGHTPDAFPIYVSKNLHHWRFVNYVLTPGHYAAQSRPATGGYPGGEYWAPEIHKIGRNWICYYGALMQGQGKFGIFVSWTRHLFGGRWQSKLLYTDASGNIDPSVAWFHGKLNMVAAQQAAWLWTTTLSANGLFVTGPKHLIATATLPWEGTCVEGPVLWVHNGVERVLYNANSTWNDSYAIGLLTRQPAGNWVKSQSPILRSGNGMVSTGIGAQPFVGPHGLMLAFHVQLGNATHNMEGRWLAFAHLHMLNGVPFVRDEAPPRRFIKPLRPRRKQHE